VRAEDIIMYLAALKQFTKHVPDLLAYAKQANRTAFGRFLAAYHWFTSV
jgi:hypothetical protein